MPLHTLSLRKGELSNFNTALQKEWLITNGLGGYASSTVLGVNTRKYHGLLVAALNPPVNRTVCLAKVDEEINVGNQVFLLGSNEFQGVFFPQGYMHLTNFSATPFPEFTYQVADVTVKKTIFMPYLKNIVVVDYTIVNMGNAPAHVKLTPLVACRHIHATMKKPVNGSKFIQQNSQKSVRLSFPKTTLIIQAINGVFLENPNWIERLLYREDEARHESGIEDCYQPGYFQTIIPAHTQERIALYGFAEANNQKSSTLNQVSPSMSDVDAMLKDEVERKEKQLEDFYQQNAALVEVDWLSWIRLATDAFVVQNLTGQKSVIAGYHWYEPWGRDTFISLPGLLLVTGRFEDAKNVIAHFNAHCQNGLIPNFLDDRTGEAAYNTVDATLWFVNAVLQYVKCTGDFAFVRSQLWENLQAIVENHVKGTAFNIHVDSDGLLAHGERLTWMDAEVNGQAITPRAGKAVEIQALWFNCLKTVQLLAERFGDKKLGETCAGLADKTKLSFEEKFWNHDRQCLVDVISESGVDASLRPNQIIVAALDFRMLSQDKNRNVVTAVQQELLTPCGLRTLERGNSKYKGVYSGDRWTRDSAYHNGTVWPWLLGPFISAYSKANKNSERSKVFASGLLAPFFVREIQRSVLGSISEIFDGEQPHTPKGCLAQAWSVAEPLHVYVEEVLQVKPRFESAVLGRYGFS